MKARKFTKTLRLELGHASRSERSFINLYRIQVVRVFKSKMEMVKKHALGVPNYRQPHWPKRPIGQFKQR